jgi:hypothetical protein
MAEEYTCIECENLYNDMDGDTDERLCNKCGCQIYEEDTGVINVDYNGNLIKERRDPNIKRSSTTHYPDWDMKKKIYITRKRKS